jgi:hypothetical protein
MSAKELKYSESARNSNPKRGVNSLARCGKGNSWP